MAYKLYIGDKLYFSWSLSAWLMFHRFGLSSSVQTTVFPADAVIADSLAHLAPARTVPTVVTPEGAILSDTFAIAEELATRHPDLGFWPTDPGARGIARTLAAEMHSGFGTLRGDWPFNLHHAYRPVTAPAAVQAELDRLALIWTTARDRVGQPGPWLCGSYSLADAIFAPMTARIATYGFRMPETAQAYVAAHLAEPAFRRWRAMGLARATVLADFERDFDPAPWPGPTPLSATAVDHGPSVNATCPYSGDPVTHFLTLNGASYGFCNAFCRDKTLADPAAWPAFMALRDQ